MRGWAFRTAGFVGKERSALHRKREPLGVVTANKAGARVAHLEEGEEGGARAAAESGSSMLTIVSFAKLKENSSDFGWLRATFPVQCHNN